MKYKENLKLIFMLLLVSIGYSTGLHYQKIIGLNVLTVAKGCFEFGLLSLMLGKTISSSVAELLVSSLKHYFVMGLSSLNKMLFPFLYINLFGIGFKMGVCTSTVTFSLGINGVFSAFYIILFSLIVMLFSAFFAYCVFNRQIYRIKINRITNEEIMFYKKTSKGLLTFLGTILILLCFGNFAFFGIKGFFNTLL